MCNFPLNVIHLSSQLYESAPEIVIVVYATKLLLDVECDEVGTVVMFTVKSSILHLPLLFPMMPITI